MIAPDRRRRRRHTFHVIDCPRVELRHIPAGRRRPPLTATLVNLAPDGMAAVFESEPDHRELLLPLSARFALDARGGPIWLELDCEAVHWYRLLGRRVYGFRFVGINTPEWAAERRALVQFLRDREAATARPHRPDPVGKAPARP